MVEYENSSLMITSAEASVSSSAAPKRKRSLPGTPHPDAEVIALSPKTLMATNRFVCEICSKGFQRDQNLQLHRRGHNLPWKLKQRSSSEVRKRAYVCPEPTCVHHDPSRALGDLTGIKKHFYRKHGEKKWKCERCSKKYAVQSDWKSHMKTCGTREYRCDCGTLFSRRDSFITHRAFCDALAQESERSEPVAVQIVSPPPEINLTPSTGILSPVLSVQSSELPENPTGFLQEGAAGSPASTGSSSGVFTSMLTSSAPPEKVSRSSHSPSSYSDLLCAMVGTHRTTAEPMSLSLSSSLYLSEQDHHRHYAPSPQPSLSATALLQKAAQMGSIEPNSSLLHCLGLNQENNQDNNSVASGLGLGLPSSKMEDMMMGQSALFGNKPTTLDLLGLGIGSAGGSPSDGFSAFFTSFGGVTSGGDTWEDQSDRKPDKPIR